MKSVYVMKSNGAYKIGVSKSPKKRLRELGIGNYDIELIYESEMMCNAYSVESALHKKFHNCSMGREWFHITDENKMLEDVCTLVDEMGIFEQDENLMGKENDSKNDSIIESIF